MAAVLGHRDDLYIVSVADDLAQEPDTLLKLMSTEYDALLQVSFAFLFIYVHSLIDWLDN
jgi:hypothetical protein